MTIIKSGSTAAMFATHIRSAARSVLRTTYEVIFFPTPQHRKLNLNFQTRKSKLRTHAKYFFHFIFTNMPQIPQKLEPWKRRGRGWPYKGSKYEFFHTHRRIRGGLRGDEIVDSFRERKYYICLLRWIWWNTSFGVIVNCGEGTERSQAAAASLLGGSLWANTAVLLPRLIYRLHNVWKFQSYGEELKPFSVPNPIFIVQNKILSNTNLSTNCVLLEKFQKHTAFTITTYRESLLKTHIFVFRGCCFYNTDGNSQFNSILD